MKIKLLSENSFLVFVIDKIPNIKNDQELSDYLKSVFEIIKEKNQFDIYGYYDVLIYKDINYGLIIKLDKDFNFEEEIPMISYDTDGVMLWHGKRCESIPPTEEELKEMEDLLSEFR